MKKCSANSSHREKILSLQKKHRGENFCHVIKIKLATMSIYKLYYFSNSLII